MASERLDYLLAMSRMLASLRAMGVSVEESKVSGKPAIEHLVEAYDAVPADEAPTPDDPTWRSFLAARMAASVYHLGGSVESSTLQGRSPIEWIAAEISSAPSLGVTATDANELSSSN